MIKKKLIIMSKIVKHKDTNSEIVGYLTVDSLTKRVSYMNNSTIYKNKLKVKNATIRKSGDNIKVIFNDCADNKVPIIHISEGGKIKTLQKGLRVLEKSDDNYVVCTADGKILYVSKEYLINKYKEGKKELINVCVVNGKSVRGIKQAIPIAIKNAHSEENNTNTEVIMCSESPYIKNLNHASLSLVKDKECMELYYKFELMADSIIIPIKVSKVYKGKGLLNIAVNEKGLIDKVTIRTSNKDELIDVLINLIHGVKAKSFDILVLNSNQNNLGLLDCMDYNITYDTWSNSYCINANRNNDKIIRVGNKDLDYLKENFKTYLIELVDKLVQYSFLDKQVVNLLTSELSK